LIWDAAGNLYGTAQANGAYGQGVVFKLSPAGGGAWTETVLYAFQGEGDGCWPFDILFGPAGGIYGVAGCGGKGYQGIVFELTESGGVWTRHTVHRFSETNGDAYGPNQLTTSAAGDLYTTGFWGGKYGYGAAVKLTPNLDGTWTESDLHAFTGGADGSNPTWGLIIGTDGNLYGTTPYGGNAFYQSGIGVVYSLKP